MKSALLALLFVVGDPIPPEKPANKPAPKPAAAMARYKAPRSAVLSSMPSAPGLFVGVVHSDTAGGWLVMSAGMEMAVATISEDRKSVFFEGEAGAYAVLFFPPGGQIIQPQLTRVVLGGGTPNPKPDPGPDPNPAPVNPYDKPTGPRAQAVNELREFQMEPADAKKLAQFYERAKEVVEGSLAAVAAGVDPEIGSPADLRGWLTENGPSLGLSGKYSGLAEIVDEAMAEMMGTEADRSLTDSDPGAFAALSWAVWEAGH